MNHYVIKLKESRLFVSGYISYKVQFSSELQFAMMFDSITILIEFAKKHIQNTEHEIYEIILKRI